MPDSTESIRVLLTLDLADELRETIVDVSERVELLVHPAERARDVPDDAWAAANVLYTTDVVPEPEQAPHLRWIHTHWAGVERLLDQPILQTEDVLLTTSSGIHASNMAEYAFTMMLAFGHRLPTMQAYQQERNWPSEDRSAFLPKPLRGSTVGIVGYGSIGREIARLAQAFGMEVLAVKRDVRQPVEHDSYVLPGCGDPEGVYFHRLYPPEALASMVRVCDFVVVVVPLTESTRGMVDAAVFEAMKPDAVLINISRGGVVDEAALLAALEQGQIAGAASDVFASEPLPDDSPLWSAPNLIISPHVAGMMPDYDEKAVALFAENLGRYLGRKDLLNVVERTRGY